MTSTRADAVAHDLASLIAEHGVPGVSAAWGSPEGVETAVAGTINTNTGYPVRPDTHFLVGSITKTFTAVTAMRLVERGLLELDAPIRRDLPDLTFAAPDEDAADRITLRQLLSHQAGVPSDNFEDFGRGDDCLARFTADLRRHCLAHEPGEFFSYSNGGFSLIGRIIEAVTGQVFDAALRAEVLAPLGLDTASLLPEHVMTQSVAIGHEELAAPGEAPAMRPFHWPALRAIGPEGMLVIAPSDLVRYGLALAAPDASGLLAPATVGRMFSPQIRVPDWVHGPATAWGLGWRRHISPDDEVVGHTGSIAGSLAALQIDLEAGAVLALAVNAFGPRGASVRRAAQQLVADAIGRPSLAPAPPFPTEPVEPGDLTPFVGTYSQLNSEYVVGAGPDGLRLSATFGRCVIDEGVANYHDAPMRRVAANRFTFTHPEGGGTVVFHAREGSARPEVLYTGASGAFRTS